MNQLKIGLIGGSGLNDVFSGGEEVKRHQIESPFGRPSDEIVQMRVGEADVFQLLRHGPGHLLNPTAVPYRANIFALKQLGVTHILATGAVGSLRQELRPRDLVVVDQIIDKTVARANTFFEQAAVHVDFADPFCPVLRKLILEAAAGKPVVPTQQADAPPTGEQSPPGQPVPSESAPAAAKIETAASHTVHDRGCYVAMEGPAFSTRAESLMNRLLGGDLIGMTALPEAKLAREAEIPYALIALVTDYDSWRPAAAGETNDERDLLDEIRENLRTAAQHAAKLMLSTIALMATRPQAMSECPARNSLARAIWSDHSKIPSQEVQRLWPLWGRYFPNVSQSSEAK